MSTRSIATVRAAAKEMPDRKITTGINRLGVSEANLVAQGLFRPAKNTWSATEALA